VVVVAGIGIMGGVAGGGRGYKIVVLRRCGGVGGRGGGEEEASEQASVRTLAWESNYRI
jgi:hypothetical protein